MISKPHGLFPKGKVVRFFLFSKNKNHYEKTTIRYCCRLPGWFYFCATSFCGVGYYGLHVHEKALERGVKVTGATVHFVNEGMDEGPIIAQKAVAVEDDDTPESLQRRVMEQAEWLLLPQAVDDIANGRICVVDGKVKHNK